MLACYQKAALMSPGRVLGRQLLPLSSWHVAALDALGSPYFSGGAPTVSDLVIAVDVCSSGWVEDARTRAQQATRSLRGPHGLIAWWVGLRFDGRRELAAMGAHVSAYMDWPQFWSDGTSRRPGVQLAYHLVATLMSNTTLTEARCWNMPINLAQCYVAGVACNNGADVADADIEDAMRILQPCQN